MSLGDCNADTETTWPGKKTNPSNFPEPTLARHRIADRRQAGNRQTPWTKLPQGKVRLPHNLNGIGGKRFPIADGFWTFAQPRRSAAGVAPGSFGAVSSFVRGWAA